MSDFARVDSIDALRDFRVALLKFAEVAQVALADGEGDLSRTLLWLESEQTSYWAGQVRKCQEMVSRAAEKLREKQVFKDASGRVPAAVDEQKALKLAKAKLERAQEKQLAVKKSIRLVQKAVHDYKGSVQGLTSAVAHDIPLSVARLDHLAGLLSQYVELAAPTRQGEAAAGSAGGPMGRLDNSPAPDAAALAAGSADEDLPDFPAFDPPQVVLVHTHRPTGLVLAADGKTPADAGDQYRPFASVDEAEAYAAAKVDADPMVECAVYGHDKARLATVARQADPTAVRETLDPG
jgi:hypothetical protein